MMEYYSAIKNPIIKDLMKQKQIYDTGLKEKSKLQIDCVTRMANTSRIPASFKNNKEWEDFHKNITSSWQDCLKCWSFILVCMFF